MISYCDTINIRQNIYRKLLKIDLSEKKKWCDNRNLTMRYIFVELIIIEDETLQIVGFYDENSYELLDLYRA